MITIEAEDLKRGVEIRVPGYKGSPEDPDGAQIFIEERGGKLRVHVWSDSIDPVTTEIAPV